MGDVTTGGSTTTPNSKQVTKTTDMLLGGLQDAYKGGVSVYGQPLYTGPGNTTRSAWNSGIDNAYGLLGAGGLTEGQHSAAATFGNLRGAYQGLGDNNGLTGQQSGAMTGLGGLGSHYAGLGQAYDPNSSAYKTLRQGVIDDTLSNLGSQFTASGRFGGGSYVDTASQGLGDALAGLDYSNMQNDINNRYRSLDAQRGVFGDVFGMGQKGVENQFGALAGEHGAASSLFGAGQQQINNRNAAVDQLTQIGAAQDADSLAGRLADYDLFTRTNDADWEAISRASSILNGTAGASGSTTTNSVPWWAAIAGLGATGASIFG